MAKRLQICRQHDLSHDQCREIAQELLEKLVDRFGGQVSCQGDDFQYVHPTGIKAEVVPDSEKLNVDVKLGMLTSALAPKLDQEINRVLDDYIGLSE